MRRGVEASRTTTASEVRTDDWPAQATDAVVKVVGSVHDKVTGPIQTLARAIVYGLLAAVLGTAALVLFVIFALRLLNSYLPDAWFGSEHMWAADLLVGLFLTAAGLVALRLARRTPKRD